MTDSAVMSRTGRRSWRATGAVAVAFGLVAVALPAQADDDTATVTGVVVGEDGSTDTHAVVQISPEGGGSVQSATVDADGAFEIDDIEPGSYYVRAYDSRDSIDAVYAGAGWNGSESIPNFHDPVEIGAGTTEVAFELSFLQGVVVEAVDDAGEPVPNLPLWIEYYDPAEDAWEPLMHDAPLTREDGLAFAGMRDERDAVRICLRDVNYMPENRPELRYHTACWEEGDDIEDATPITFEDDDRKLDITIPLEVAGASIWYEYPLVHGRAEVGETLTAEPHRWEPTEVELSYAWGSYEGAEFVAIPGATDRTFVPTADLDGVRLALRITGEAEGHVTVTATVEAGTVGALAPEVASFELSGTAVAGDTVTAEIGATTPADANAEVSWYADGVRVPGVGGETLDITDELAGSQISATLRVYDFNPGGESEYEASLFLYASLPVPENTAGTVAIDGPMLPQLKDVLVVATDGWSDDASLSYQWYRGNDPIAHANGQFYWIGPDDDGYSLKVEVTASVPGAEDVSVMSAATRRVGLGGVIDTIGGPGTA